MAAMSNRRDRDDGGAGAADPAVLATWQAAYAAVDLPVSPAGDGCPTTDALWLAARGQLPPAERRAVLEHLLTCPACDRDFRLARTFEAEHEEPRTVPAPPRPRFVPPPLLAAVAAALVVAVGLLVLPRAPVWKGGGVDSRTPPTLPRQGAVLTWTAVGPEGTTYDVEVRVAATDELIARGADLAAPAFPIPDAALAGLPPRARLRWEVTAELPYGAVEGPALFEVEVP
jgi:hypothetical protein